LILPMMGGQQEVENMKKLSLSKKLLLAGSIVALAIACQSKPVHQPVQPAQPLHTDVEEQGDEEDEESSFWDQTEPLKTEEKQHKDVSAPAPAEPAKVESPKSTVAVPVEQPAAPVVEAPATGAPSAPVVETPAVVPSAPDVEAKTAPVPAVAEPVVEVKAPEAVAAPAEQQVAAPDAAPSSAPLKAENDAAVTP
jgi:hypothetical protein